MRQEIRRILFECTQIHESRGTTGIPRVVRSLAEYGVVAAREAGVELIPVLVSGRRFYPVSLVPASIETLPTLAARTRRTLERRFGPKWGGRLSATVQRVSARLRKWLSPRKLVRAATAFRLRHSGAEIRVQPTDVLVLTGSRWTAAARTAAALAARAEIPTGAIVYDLIPIDHPEFFKHGAVTVFREWIENVTAVADVFLSISQRTRDRLWQYVQQRDPQRVMHPGQFPSFTLGATIDTRAAGGSVCPGLEPAFAADRPGHTYLTVSTIEPRKNQAFLLDAFEDVWTTHPEARLCIVGRIGWLCDELLERISRHPRFGRQLFLFNDLSDGELDYCYRHAKAFLFASKEEGYGLPIVEALCHGLPVLASDIPVHREVGGAFCAYFDLAKPGELAGWIRELEASGTLPGVAPAHTYRPRDWMESSRDFIRQILRAVACRPDRCRSRRAAA